MHACYTRSAPAVQAASSVASARSPLPRTFVRHANMLTHNHNKRFMRDRSIGEYVPERRPRVEHPHHFQPLLPEPLKKLDPLPLKKPAPPKTEPHLVPSRDTHTNLLQKQRDNIRMQFQLEPASRTLVKQPGVNLRVRDYEECEVFTRAPWPYYREICLNRPSTMHALNPPLMLQVINMIRALEFNKDITAGMIVPVHPRGKNYPVKTSSICSGNRQALSWTGASSHKYQKALCSGLDMGTLNAILEEGEARKKRHAEKVEADPEYAPMDLESTIDAMPGNPQLAKYFRSVYQMAFDMSRVRLHMVTLLDGVVAGAGAGVFLQNRYRVATENTRIAFPQVLQGWFPDAGSSYLLSKLDGHMGMFLALTGWEVRGYDAVRLGLATHYCESDETHRFGKRMGDSSLNYQFAEDTVEQAFGMFSEGETHLPLPLPEMHRVLNDIFHVDSAAEVLLYINEVYQPDLTALEQWQFDCHVASEKPGSFGRAPTLPPRPKTRHNAAELAFVDTLLSRMMACSPTSLQVTFKLMKLAQFLPLERCLQLEYRLSQRLCSQLNNPRTESELFTAPQWKRKSFMSPADLDKLFEEDWDEDKELHIAYPEKKQPTWYI